MSDGIGKLGEPFAQAAWISSGLIGGPRTMTPAALFRKAFHLEASWVSARLSITALGFCECEINGLPISEDVFTPGWTDYRKRVYFRTYEVGEFLREGENAIGVVLGDGWYSGHVALGERQTYGSHPSVLVQLEIETAGGQRVVIGSDRSWKTTPGPILENDLLMGEVYDARHEKTGWSAPGFDDRAWLSATEDELEPRLLEPAPLAAVRRRERFAPRQTWDLGERPFPARVFDFGQNFAGRARLRIRAPRGTTVKLRFAEMVLPNGDIYTDNLRGARATDIYTCRGGGLEEWEPRFTYHGFRYVEVVGLKADHEFEIEGIALYSDLPETGGFACSHPLLNQLQQNIVWSQKSNFLEVPTDCPQRDERLGWTGDAQIFARTACFNLDVRAFFHKWMVDLRDTQSARGAISPVAPNPPGFDEIVPFEDAGAAWSDALIICPWTIYLCYGDRRILAENFEAMERFMAYVAEFDSRDGIRAHPSLEGWKGFGDWLAQDGGSVADMGATPHDLIGTAFYADLADLMARISRVLERPVEVGKYEALHAKVAEAFQRRFVTRDGLLVSATQTACVLALHFSLVSGIAWELALEALVRDIELRGNHLSTGFLGTPYLLEVLEAGGRLDLAYRLIEQETFPSWLFPIKNGATTVWERWDGWTPERGMQNRIMNSFNHYAYGAVGAWMYRSVAGLDLEEDAPGYQKILFRPRPGGTLTWASTSLLTARGEVAIRWELVEDGLQLRLTVPPGATARLDLPAPYRAEGESDVLLPGLYEITARTVSAKLPQPPAYVHA